MNRAVYSRILTAFGKTPGLWVGWIFDILRTLFNRVWLIIIVAQLSAAVVDGDISRAKELVFLFLIVSIAGVVFGVFGELLIMYWSNQKYNVESRAFYKKITSKDMAFFRDNQTGYIITIFRQYLDLSIQFLRFLMQDVTRNIISLAVPVIVLMAADIRIGLVAVGIVLLQWVYVVWASSQANDVRMQSHHAYRQMTAEVSDALTNIVAFKSSGREKEALNRVSRLAVEETDAYFKRHKINTIYDAPRAIISGIGVSLALYIIATTSSNTPASVALIVLTIAYMFQIMRNVQDLPFIIQKHDDFVTKLYATLDYLKDDYETIRDPNNPKDLKITDAAISLSAVNFNYSDSASHQASTVFDNLNLEIKGGERLGVVGLSGAGKSTLASLLMRFDEIDSGTIKIDGIDIRDVTQSQLHQAIAYVPQEPLLFHRSIRDNIAYFMDEATDEGIERAAKAAHAHEFIVDLPNGYDTLVGERGIKLSGGQKQRVAIARAILKDSPIILFDEATSALDSESEAIIQRALPEILGQRTAIVIAHRLSTVADLDRIIVLEKGKIIEQGTHEELIKANGRYAKLWQKQTKERL